MMEMRINSRRIIAYVVLILVSFLCLFWFYALFINATRSNGDLTRGFSLIPGTALIKNWTSMMHCALPIMSSMRNSLFVALTSSLLSSYFSIMTAYGIHAYCFKGKKLFYTIMVGFMMIPKQVTALGFVDLVGRMHLRDSFIPLIIPEIAAPIVFYYMIKYMESTLPMSLVEAARIDGASELFIFNKIVFPLMRPAFAVQMIFKFVESWNNYFIPALILHDNSKKTMPIVISLLRSSNFADYDNGLIYMVIAFSILPSVIIYLFLSRFIISGITSGGVKG
ncbi:MAG: carbohydrate ABC transporter permease [Lachnospiraceae bacterium]|nr:carbohydrate ABC transporter permease [Lachnospiraceae bacterium]MBQ4241221.1 carbohydrate ABC transporter permease [Lachnospiraceae bacterium]